MSFEFQFKQFGLNHTSSSMKIGTDAILLGALTELVETQNILEIGCGCGIISLMLAQRSNAHITAIDIHQNSVIQAANNFNKSPWKNRLNAQYADAREYVSNSKFDLIVSNPPYFNNSLKPKSKKNTLSKHTDSLNYGELCISALRNLASDGSFWIILPTKFLNKFTIEAQKTNLNCSTQFEIYSKKESSPSLIISSWTLKQTIHKINQLHLSDLKGNPSSEFKKRTKDFYLNF